MKTELQATLVSVLLFLFLLCLLINPFFNFGVSFWDRPPLFYNSGHINTFSKEFMVGIVLIIVIIVYYVILKPENNNNESI